MPRIGQSLREDGLVIVSPDIFLNAESFEAVVVIGLLCLLAIAAGTAISRQIPYKIRLGGPVLVAVAVCFASLVYRIVADPLLVDDERAWHRQGVMVADFLVGRSHYLAGSLNEGKEGYAWLVGGLYALSTRSPFIFILLGALLLILLVPLTGALTGLVAQDLGLPTAISIRAVRAAMFFVALCPTIAFWAPRMLREVLVMFLVALAAMFFLKCITTRKLIWLLSTVATVAALTSVRGQIGIGTAAGLALSGIVVWTLRFRSWIARIVFIAPAFVVLFWVTWVYVDSMSDLSVAYTAYRNVALAEATSAFSGGESLKGASSYADIVLFNLPRVAFGPFPNELAMTPVMLLAALSNLFWLLCVAGTLVLLASRRKVALLADQPGKATHPWRSALVLIVISLTLVAILSINAGNYGLVIRMRLMPMTLLIPLAAAGVAVLGAKVASVRRVPGEIARPRGRRE